MIDNLDYLNKYYGEDEIITCGNKDDWFQKIDFYIRNNDLRNKIVKKANKKTYKYHLYENRILQILKLSNKY